MDLKRVIFGGQTRIAGAKYPQTVNKYTNKTLTLYIATYNGRALLKQFKLIHLKTKQDDLELSEGGWKDRGTTTDIGK